MMTTVKNLATLLLVAVILAACSGDPYVRTPEGIRAIGVLRVAVSNASEHPYIYWDESGQPQGIEPEVARMLARALGVQAQFIPLPDYAVSAMVESGMADIGFADFGQGTVRGRQLLETTGFYTRRPYVLTRRGQSLPNEAVLSGRVVLSQAGHRFFVGEEIELGAGIEMLLDGRVDAVLADEFSALSAVAGVAGQLQAELFHSSQKHIHVAVMSRRNERLYAFINDELTRILETGAILEIADRY